MKIFIQTFCLLGFVLVSYGQITFNGAHPLFDNQSFIFDFETKDATGRNSYTTTPIDGNQPCSGVGICELKIAWNDTNAQWEMLADDGNGAFSSTFLIFKNTVASKPNPPSLVLGTWEVNTDLLTLDQVGGNLTTTNAILTGNVQDSALNIYDEEFSDLVTVYPNPVRSILHIKTNEKLETIQIYDVRGKIVLSKYDNLEQINISRYYAGLYFLKIKCKSFVITKKIMIN